MPGTTWAGSQEYRLALPDNQMVVYSIDLDVEHPGPLVLQAHWEDNRVLSFRLVKPGGKSVAVRRSGPSPLRIEVDVTDGEAERDGPWKLSVRGLPARGKTTANLTVFFPDSPALLHQKQQATLDAELPPLPDPWREPLALPRGLSPEWARVFRKTEQFRRLVVEEATRDNFGWHDEFLRYLAEHRQQTPGPEGALTLSTRVMFKRIVAGTRKIEELNRSDDPLLVGPAPTDRRHRDTWIMLQNSRLLPLERELGGILDDLQQGHAPELAGDAWCTRFITTVMACQRNLKERTRPDALRTTSVELFAEQWEPVLAAADALESLTELP